MDREDELANKVDALMSKRMAEPDARNIPVLTDLVDAPEWLPTSGAAKSEPDMLEQLSDNEIDLLSQEIFTRVSHRIDTELATSLESRLSEQFQTQLNATVTHVLADMKQSIANEIGDAVNAALADRLRSLRKTSHK
ncbi:MAG: hypothetical protein WCL29_01335 [Pseudomonadota bacterium]